MRVDEKRKKNMKKSFLMQETISTRNQDKRRNYIYAETKTKEKGIGREKKEKRYDWMSIYF